MASDMVLKVEFDMEMEMEIQVKWFDVDITDQVNVDEATMMVFDDE